MSEQFKYRGFNFEVEVEYDTDMGAPWEEHDGHGIVSQWTSRDKRPGERVLSADRSSKRYYDVKATIEKAKREGWGLGPKHLNELEAKLGRKPTKKEIIAAAVDRDFDYLQRWCDDEWHWAVPHVTMVEHPEHETYLGGVEYDPGSSDEYHMECAHEMASELIYEWQKKNAWRLRQDLCTAQGALA